MLKLAICVLFLISSPTWASCPLPEQIAYDRYPDHGQPYWQLPEGWVGGFMNEKSYPASNKAQSFKAAKWIQLKHLPDSVGQLSCLYQGDWFTETMVLRPLARYTALKPQGKNWRCWTEIDYPEGKPFSSFQHSRIEEPYEICECKGPIESCEVEQATIVTVTVTTKGEQQIGDQVTAMPPKVKDIKQQNNKKKPGFSIDLSF